MSDNTLLIAKRTAKVTKLGNSMGLIIPAWIMEQFEIGGGDEFVLSAHRGEGFFEVRFRFDRTKDES